MSGEGSIVLLEGLGVILFGLIIIFVNLAETSLLSVGRGRLRRMAKEGSKSAKVALSLAEKPERLLGTTIVAVDVSLVGATVLTAHIVIHRLRAPGYVGVAASVLTIVVLVFCEIIPKGVALRKPLSVALLVARPFFVLVTLMAPVVRLVSAVGRGMSRLLGGTGREPKDALVEARLKALVTVGRDQGALGEHESRLIDEILEFGQIRVNEIMVPRTDMVAVPAETPIGEVVKVVMEKGFSRIPVYEGSRDNVVGVAYIKDLIGHLRAGRTEVPVREVMRRPYLVPETKRVEELLREMRRNRVHIAIVVDEFGGTAGLVTLEDLLEEIVGEIRDEHDREEPKVRWVDERTALATALLNRDEVSDYFGMELPEGDFETLGGFIMSALGRIPKVGDKVKLGGATLEVVEVRGRRVWKVKVTFEGRGQPASG
ncbi:MAG TPA: HlyC/CorC family transporter [Armatimonadetes bacterium]|nr:HlyC/CorC family transporter [Armatimonadota bacterium]